jgi:RluA family pseudouridine synthase
MDRFNPQQSTMDASADPGFVILYEEGSCLAVCKPPGLSTQAPPGVESLEVRVKAFLRRRDQIAGRVYLGIPHRLDRPASGVIVFARISRAAHRLCKQFERRQIRKTYWVCVAGRPSPESGTWSDFLHKIPGRTQGEVVPSDHPDAREAVLHYRTLIAATWGTLLEIELVTGRMHQIRIQAATRGHPVLGDAKYGSKLPFGPPMANEQSRAIALHARSIAFCHPMTKADVCVVAPLPEIWQELGLACVVGR